jgi:hypothetical protein
MPRRLDLVVSAPKSGRRPAEKNVTHRTAGAGSAGIAENVLVGHIIGLGVDSATGTSQDLMPNLVVLTLEC